MHSVFSWIGPFDFDCLHALQVAQMEAEGQQYREAALQKNNQIKSLERRVTSLEQELQEAHARVGKAAWKHEYGPDAAYVAITSHCIPGPEQK